MLPTGPQRRKEIAAVNGTLTVSITGDRFEIEDGQANRAVVDPGFRDVRTRTGIVHLIDRVLLP